MLFEVLHTYFHQVWLTGWYSCVLQGFFFDSLSVECSFLFLPWNSNFWYGSWFFFSFGFVHVSVILFYVSLLGSTVVYAFTRQSNWFCFCALGLF